MNKQKAQLALVYYRNVNIAQKSLDRHQARLSDHLATLTAEEHDEFQFYVAQVELQREAK